MPRKRKKSNRDRKAPLIFTESPVANQRNVPSPVCCALHPRTAQAVPVDQLDKSSWVSPQFSSTVQSEGQGGRRTLRRQKSSADNKGYKPECTCGSTGHDQVKGHGHAGSKYKSLEFLGSKKARTSVSVLEEVSIEENISPNVAKHQRNLRKQSLTSWIGDDCENEPVLKRKVKHKNSRLSTKSVERDDLNTGDNSIGPSTECSPLPRCPVDVCTPIINKENDTSLHTPVKQLFPGNSKEAGGISEYVQPKNMMNDVVMNSPTNEFYSQSPICDSVCDSEPEDKTPKSRYFLRKYFEMTICSTPKINHALGSRILVLDTPETEYGLPTRKRQCLQRKQDTS
ncbi:uncharacterized protein LOC117335437 [Pecten maximus]|uniref:uncharacterized protein LOC117335437 n=1 Tax=Pecten maximus TaxID=6579 RepID=UPI0014590E0A|nr:uncharacterized protein LOC117335437 [Pecten maximus]XP_033751307.1 uncharacterized protein LOC117335437 [Pecten maximus]